MSITPEQATYFSDMEELFLTRGWKTFIADLEANHKALVDGALEFTKSETFFIAKGRSQTFKQVIGFQELVEQAKASLLEDETT